MQWAKWFNFLLLTSSEDDRPPPLRLLQWLRWLRREKSANRKLAEGRGFPLYFWGIIYETQECAIDSFSVCSVLLGARGELSASPSALEVAFSLDSLWWQKWERIPWREICSQWVLMKFLGQMACDFYIIELHTYYVKRLLYKMHHGVLSTISIFFE